MTRLLNKVAGHIQKLRMTMNKQIEFILYVKDQQASKRFYSLFLGQEPVLDVPGMTEFELSKDCKLGLMPADGIHRLLDGTIPHPGLAEGIPRCELYLFPDNLEESVERAIKAGAVMLQVASDRDWGHRVAYLSDPDAHVIALAKKIK